MKKLIREPFFHFLLLGVAIFITNSIVSGRSNNQPGKIVVTQGQITSMVIGFSRTWQRPPTREELEGLIRDRVRAEVYCREAIAMGLDQDDPVIRRRLQQKLEFISDEVSSSTEPTDADLSNYLKTHGDVFRLDRQFTFYQVYLDPAKHGDELPRHVAELLKQLREPGHEGVDLTSLGDALLLEHRFEATAATEISKQFGDKFALKLGDVPTGQWFGPVESGYGVHLVFVKDRTEGRLPELAEVRDQVQRDWSNERRAKTNEKFFQDLLNHYQVVVEEIDLAKVDQKFANTK